MIRRRGLVLCSVIAALLAIGVWWPRHALGDEVRPALMKITELPDRRYDILWKQPARGEFAVRLEPRISGGLLDRPPTSVDAAPDYYIRIWRNLDAGPEGLNGRTLQIEGLERTITDAMILIVRANGAQKQHILRPQSSSMVLELGGANASTPEFLVHGFRHILAGPDHLLFVLALLLIVKQRGRLVKTVTAFTLAHSLTLAAATLGVIDMSVPLLNTLVAMSILFIAPEVIRAERGGTSLTIQYPWLVAFGFGLLHGMGFATGLTPLELDKTQLLVALVLFNVGVEIGQLAFIALVLALIRAFQLMQVVWPRPLQLAPVYVIGTLGSFWTLQYCVQLFGGT